jgi:RecA-family ATPase
MTWRGWLCDAKEDEMLQKDSIVVVLRTDRSYVRVEKAWLVWYAGESHTAKVMITMLGTIDEAMVRVSGEASLSKFQTY